MRPSLVKPSLQHTLSNVLSWTKVPKDLLISQSPTLEVDLSRLETLKCGVTLAVTLASGVSQVRFRAPARGGTVRGHYLGPLAAPQRVGPHGVTAVKNGVNLTEKNPFLQGSYSKGYNMHERFSSRSFHFQVTLLSHRFRYVIRFRFVKPRSNVYGVRGFRSFAPLPVVSMDSRSRVTSLHAGQLLVV